MGKVEISCPRCSGHGVRPEWQPDAGVCYRCHGKRFVSVDPEIKLRSLVAKRRAFVAMVRELKTLDGKEAELLKERLGYLVQDGQRVHTELEIIRCEYPDLKIDWSILDRPRSQR